MSDRGLRALAVLLGAVAVAATVAGIVLLRLTWDVPRPEDFAFPSFRMEVLDRVQFLLVSLVGASVAALRPRNRIGWLLCVGGLGFPLWDFTEAYATYHLHLRPLPGGLVAAWSTNWVWALSWWMPGLLFLLFPTGRLPSRRWAPIAGMVVGVSALVVTLTALAAGPLVQFPDTANPIGVIPLGDPEAALGPLFGLMVLGFALATVALALRFRRAVGDERQQLRWFALAAGLFVGYMLLNFFGVLAGAADQVGGIVVSLGLAGALMVSLLKHRLYDIDVVISRTVSYAALTGLLAGAYLGTVMVLQTVLTPLTPDSQLSVAGATLAVAAAFGPLRRRVQTVVDRRFNRHRYDAQVTLERFTADLRDEVHLEEITQRLAGAITSTVQPASVQVWLAARNGAGTVER
jgi:hypothetical protein